MLAWAHLGPHWPLLTLTFPATQNTRRHSRISALFLTFYFQDWDWFNGRNFCRDRCMDLVSFDTKGEFEMFAEIMKRGNYIFIF